MDPVTLGLGAISIGMQLYGGLGASGEAKKQAQLSSQNFQLENQVNDQRRQAMEVSASRQQLENFRNSQRVRAAGLNAATSQGANLGSGLQGGQAQATSQALFNSQGINQNLQIGRNIFGLDNKINNNKSQISESQGEQATYQGWANLGAGIGKNASTISNLASFGQTQITNFASSMSYPGTYTSQNIPT